jgi:hypothetical protein
MVSGYKGKKGVGVVVSSTGGFYRSLSRKVDSSPGRLYEAML